MGLAHDQACQLLNIKSIKLITDNIGKIYPKAVSLLRTHTYEWIIIAKVNG